MFFYNKERSSMNSNPNLLFVCLMIIVLSGCSTVDPWEKGFLAKNEMAFTPDPLETALSDHVYFSKEATSSGADVSGGGCGCN